MIFDSYPASESKPARFLIDGNEVSLKEFKKRYQEIFNRKINFDKSWFLPPEEIREFRI